MTFELSETATEHIHMPENLYRQRGREEVGWGERERGSGLGREGGRKWVGGTKRETDKDAERKGRREVGGGEGRRQRGSEGMDN